MVLWLDREAKQPLDNILHFLVKFNDSPRRLVL